MSIIFKGLSLKPFFLYRRQDQPKASEMTEEEKKQFDLELTRWEEVLN